MVMITNTAQSNLNILLSFVNVAQSRSDRKCSISELGKKCSLLKLPNRFNISINQNNSLINDDKKNKHRTSLQAVS